MNIRTTPLDGVVVIEPRVFNDDRGFFLETYHQSKLAEQGFNARFVQDNHSRSVQFALRGLHAQLKRPQGKLVGVGFGRVFDVAVDLRPESPTYRHWFGLELNDDNLLQLYVPPGFGHGFSVLSESASVLYKCTDFYDQADEICLRWDDPTLISAASPEASTGIDWQLAGATPRLSPKDAIAPTLDELEPRLRDSDAYRLT